MHVEHMSDQRTPDPLRVGDKVMWIYGRKGYTQYGEIGVVTDIGDDGYVTVLTDGDQPFRKAMGLKNYQPRTIRVEPAGAPRVVDVYRETAETFRALAATWDAAAERESVLELAAAHD